LKRKPLLSFSLIFAFRKNEKRGFRENFCFRKKILFPGWFSVFVTDFLKNFSFCENFQLVSLIWIHIQTAPESGSAFQIEKFRETKNFHKNFRENGNFCKNFCKNIKFCATFCKFFSQKAKKISFQPYAAVS
jgi:hypothetical protein